MKTKIELKHSDGLPINSEKWLIEKQNELSLWSVESNHYHTKFYSLEGLYKPINLKLDFFELNQLIK